MFTCRGGVFSLVPPSVNIANTAADRSSTSCCVFMKSCSFGLPCCDDTIYGDIGELMDARETWLLEGLDWQGEKSEWTQVKHAV
jgi:hypothetical protein